MIRGADAEARMSDYQDMMRCLWKGVADTEQQQDAADRIEELEAKLAKAVEALRFYAWDNEIRLPSDGPWGAGSTDFGKFARATLAELTGGKNE